MEHLNYKCTFSVSDVLSMYKLWFYFIISHQCDKYFITYMQIQVIVIVYSI